MDHQIPVSIPSSCRAGVAHAVDQRFELTLRLGLGLASELTAANLVKDGLQAPIDRIVAFLRPGSDASHLIFLASEDEHRIMATFLPDLDVRTIHRSNNQTTIHNELHVGCARGFSSSSGNVLRDVRCGDHHLCRGDTVVRHEGALEVLLCLGVIVDHLCHVVDELDNDLRIDICRSGLPANQDHTLLGGSTFTRRLLLQVQVAVDDEKDVHQLPLVLVNSFDLDVNQSILVDVQIHR
mmetsp:Transcript_75616/g.180676  ORF Transcript_75616/g.180676 Transcript_75616/m.180676 type:complete len:238 (-) Transcript_75616:1827-2540(-)